jgi:hypothetical protein
MNAARSAKAPDMSFASIPDTLARLQVGAETGLREVEAESRRSSTTASR